MRRMGPFLATLIAVVGLSATAQAQMGARADDASAFVTGIYASYTGTGSSGVVLDGPTARRLFTPPLAKLIVADQRASQASGDVGALDGDPFIDGQDWEITDLKVSAEPGEKNHARSVVTFRNFNEAKTVRLDLLRGMKGWQVDDIHWDRGDSLRGILTNKQ